MRTTRPAARGRAALALAVLLAAAGAGADEPNAAGAAPFARPYRLSPHVAPGETYMGIRLLGTLALARTAAGDQPVAGLSGLAWDEDENILYAVSDRGALLHLRPRFEGERLVDAEFLARYRLRDAAGRPLRGGHGDAEGLAALGADNGRRGDTRLLIAFERFPRVAEYSTGGDFLRNVPLPEPFERSGTYASRNKALESVTWHPVHGLLAAPERPLPQRGDTIPIFSARGQVWEYTLNATPNASLVAMEALPDGSLLTLERGYGMLLFPIVVSVRRTPPLGTGPDLPAATLAVMDTSKGFGIDNFEGLARHRAMRFLAVSDDNAVAYQRTLLTYFEALEPPPDGEETDFPNHEPRQESAR